MKFTIGDATYHYEVTGAGPPIVLLHGFTGSMATWSTFVKMWQDQYQLITIDLPGHGQTSMKTPRSMEDCCNDLQQLFNHLQLTSFHLLGYSMGGRVALSFAILYPQFILSLTLESASPGLQGKAEQKARQINDEKLAIKLEAEGIEAFVGFWENIPLFATQKKLPNDIQQFIRKERLSQSDTGLACSLRSMGTGSQASWWDHLGDISQPVLLIVGQMDMKFVELNEMMAKAMPRADVAIVENVGHAIHVEDPEKFDKLVRAFILRHNS